MIEQRPSVNTNTTPTEITVSMILHDLAEGRGKKEMCVKYNVKKWELDEVFKHPKLKGQKPAKIKRLSFTFVDDTTEVETPTDPDQVTIEQVIEEEEEALTLPTIGDTMELVTEQQDEEFGEEEVVAVEEEDEFDSFEL